MVYHPDDTTTSPEEDTEYADIYIPVPYDPEIPGVRCVDAEEVENVDEKEPPAEDNPQTRDIVIFVLFIVIITLLGIIVLL